MNAVIPTLLFCIEEKIGEKCTKILLISLMFGKFLNC